MNLHTCKILRAYSRIEDHKDLKNRPWKSQTYHQWRVDIYSIKLYLKRRSAAQLIAKGDGRFAGVKPKCQQGEKGKWTRFFMLNKF